MAAGRDVEHTRFPFLATVRLLVAIVVTVLAAAVVVMVIAVVHRPVELGVRSYGYVQTLDWWWIESNTTPRPAEEVLVLFILDAVNPSGRGQIEGNINFIRLIDIPNESFTGMVQFGPFKPKAGVQFDLPPQSSHRYRRWMSLQNPDELYYLYDKHRQDKSGFSAMLVVETTYKPAHSEKSIDANFYCWPVTFLRSFADTPAGAEVTCKTTQEMGYNVSWQLTPPRPSPLPLGKLPAAGNLPPATRNLPPNGKA